MEVAAEQVPYVAEGGGEDGGTSAVRGAVPMDGERWVDAGVGGAQPHEFAAGFTTWYLERMEAGTPMLLEARDDTATRQGDGQTTYDGTVQPGAVGMEVERPTDGAVGLGDATGVTTTGSTDTAAAGAGMDVTTTDGAGGKRKKKRKNPNRKKGGTAQPRRRDR